MNYYEWAEIFRSKITGSTKQNISPYETRLILQSDIKINDWIIDKVITRRFRCPKTGSSRYAYIYDNYYDITLCDPIGISRIVSVYHNCDHICFSDSIWGLGYRPEFEYKSWLEYDAKQIADKLEYDTEQIIITLERLILRFPEDPKVAHDILDKVNKFISENGL